MLPPQFCGKKVTSRFLRHFNILSIDEFNNETLRAIFSKIVLWHLDARCGCWFTHHIKEKRLHLKFVFAGDFQRNLIHVLMKSFSEHYSSTMRYVKRCCRLRRNRTMYSMYAISRVLYKVFCYLCQKQLKALMQCEDYGLTVSKLKYMALQNHCFDLLLNSRNSPRLW